MLSKYLWDNISQEYYIRNVGPERTDISSQENRLFQICLVACFLTGYNITEQSWPFFFNVGSGVHLSLTGQQWTGADIDWNTINIVPHITGNVFFFLIYLVKPCLCVSHAFRHRIQGKRIYSNLSITRLEQLWCLLLLLLILWTNLSTWFCASFLGF